MKVFKMKSTNVIRGLGLATALSAGLAGCASEPPHSIQYLGHVDKSSLKSVSKEVSQESKQLDTNQQRLLKQLEARKAKAEIKPVAPKYDPLESMDVSLDLNNASVGQALRAFAEQAGLNLIVDPAVLNLKEKASMHLTHVTAREVFNHLLNAFNVSGKVSGDTLVVKLMDSQVYSLDFLNTSTNVTLDDGGNVFGSNTSSSGSGSSTGGTSGSGGNSELQGNFTLRSQNGKRADSNAYDQLEMMLTQLLGVRRQGMGTGNSRPKAASARMATLSTPNNATVRSGMADGDDKPTYSLNRMSGTLFVRARPDKLRSITKLVNTYKHVLGRQVLIQAQLLDVTLNDNFHFGVDWNLMKKYVAGVVGTTPYQLASASAMFPGSTLPARTLTIPSQLIGTSATTAGAGLAYADNGFAAAVNALQHFGMVKVLSNPSILAKNSVPAMLSVGSTQRYIAQSSVTITNPGGGASTTNTDVQTNSVFSGIVVGVVPFIKSNGEVELMIHPMQTAVDQNSLALVDVGGGNKITLPKVDFKGITTTLDINNGDTVILGGLIDQQDNNGSSGIPGAVEMPVLGKLFGQSSRDRATRELVIVLRVKVL